MLDASAMRASQFTKFIKVAAVIACLGVGSSACFWRERDVHDDRRDRDDHHDDHRGDHRDDRH